MTEPVQCLRCGVPMVRQPERLDLSWAGDGPNADDVEFRGIFAEVYRCRSCRGVATRPVTLSLPAPAGLAAGV